MSRLSLIGNTAIVPSELDFPWFQDGNGVGQSGEVGLRGGEGDEGVFPGLEGPVLEVGMVGECGGRSAGGLGVGGGGGVAGDGEVITGSPASLGDN